MKRVFVFALIALLINLAITTTAPAQSSDSERIVKVKHAVDKIGVDENVTVKLMDGSKIKGRIREIGDKYFVVVEKKTAAARELTFAQVDHVKRANDNPFANPEVLMGLTFIPLILGMAFWARNKD